VDPSRVNLESVTFLAYACMLSPAFRFQCLALAFHPRQRFHGRKQESCARRHPLCSERHRRDSPEENRLDRAEALKLYTIGSSWFSTEDGKKGALAPGHLADVALLSADYSSQRIWWLRKGAARGCWRVPLRFLFAYR